MKKPKMIIFDYGHTLVYENQFDALTGWTSVLEQVQENPKNISPQELFAVSHKIFADIAEETQEIEVHNHAFQRLLFEYLQLGFDKSFDDLEEIFWDAAAPGVAMPDIGDLLDYLFREGIRTAVISNLSLSCKTLTNRINRLVPNNQFEFIIATSEYGFKKPREWIFKLALAKARLAAEEVWYCGDNPIADIYGAHRAGIFPIWYQYEHPAPYHNYASLNPDVPHMLISCWADFLHFISHRENFIA